MKKIVMLAVFLLFSGIYLCSLIFSGASFFGGVLSGKISLLEQNLTCCGSPVHIDTSPFKSCAFSFLFSSFLVAFLSLLSDDYISIGVIFSGILGGEAISYLKWISFLSSIQRGGIIRSQSGLFMFKASNVHITSFLPCSIWTAVVPPLIMVSLGIFVEVKRSEGEKAQ